MVRGQPWGRSMTEQVELLGPTVERLRHAKGLVEPPEVTRTRTRRAWRLGSIVEAMNRDGVVEDRCLQDFERFEEDWAMANSAPPCTALYGDKVDGTKDPHGRAELSKANARRRVEAALSSIGSPHGRLALMMAVVESGGNCRPHTMEEIGRACSSSRNRVQAVVAGRMVLREALYQLRVHYDGDERGAPGGIRTLGPP